MLYIVFTSSIFRKSSLDELGSIAPFKIIGEFGNFLVIDSDDDALHEKSSSSLLTYCALPILLQGSIAEKRYRESILALIRNAGLAKGQTIKLECVNLNSRTVYSAKDLEVWLGLQLEGLGYLPDLQDPDILVYLVLLDMRCYVGYMETAKLQRPFVNPLRYYHRKRLVSRSELKLEQAFDDFKVPKGGIAIDLGAAPGGWSCYLARMGFKVIAVDSAAMDYEAIDKTGIKLKRSSGSGKIRARELEGCDILHVKETSESAAKRIAVHGIDLITDDMNTDCNGTYAAIKPYIGMLRHSAAAIITVKCISKNIPKYTRQAAALFGKEFVVMGMRVLPSNRQEFTLFARRK